MRIPSSSAPSPLPKNPTVCFEAPTFNQKRSFGLCASEIANAVEKEKGDGQTSLSERKKMSPASSPLVPVTSRPLSLFGATEESASAVVHFCTHLTDGRRGGRTTTTTAGAKGAREKEEEKTNFFSRVSNPDLPPFLPTSSVRYASPNFRPGRAFEKRERSLTLLDPRTPLSRKRPFCARYSEAEGNDCFFAPFLCRVRAA